MFMRLFSANPYHLPCKCPAGAAAPGRVIPKPLRGDLQARFTESRLASCAAAALAPAVLILTSTDLRGMAVLLAAVLLVTVATLCLPVLVVGLGICVVGAGGEVRFVHDDSCFA